MTSVTRSGRRTFAPIALLCLSAACTERDAVQNSASAPSVAENAVAENEAAAEPSQGCAEVVRAEIDAGSFAAALGDGAPSAAQLETLRGQAERLFRMVAGEMCASGEIDAAAVAPIRRLLVQYGGGADNTAIYTDPEVHEADVLVFQYVFAGDEAGTLSVPEAADLKEGLLCHFRPQANQAMCAGRTP